MFLLYFILFFVFAAIIYFGVTKIIIPAINKVEEVGEEKLDELKHTFEETVNTVEKETKSKLKENKKLLKKVKEIKK